MFVGYARVSTIDQHLDLQQDALVAAQCGRIFTDTASGAKAQRPGLAEALQCCRPGDTLMVWKLDRLGRFLPHLVETVRDLFAKGVEFNSLQENIDTTTSVGKLIFHIFASLFSLRWPSLSGTSSAREHKPDFRRHGHAAEKAVAPKAWMKKNRRQRWH